MLLETLFALAIVCVIGLFVAYMYPSCIKNRVAFKEFEYLRRALYSAKSLEEVADIEEWFSEFIVRKDLTKDERNFYDEEFLHIFVAKVRVLQNN